MGIDPKWHMESTWQTDRVFQRFLLHSTVAKVVQDARCPVWLDNAPSARSMAISDLVCFLNLKLNCERLIRFASRIAGECEARMLLFHCTVSTRIFARPANPAMWSNCSVTMSRRAESAIDQLQVRCSTTAATVVMAGDAMAALGKTLKGYSAPLIVLDRVSDRWGDNHKIFEIIRHCRAPILIRAESKKTDPAAPSPRKTIDPFFLLLLSTGIGVALIYLIMHLALQNNGCNFAAIRCQTPTDVLFGVSSAGRPATSAPSGDGRRDRLGSAGWPPHIRIFISRAGRRCSPSLFQIRRQHIFDPFHEDTDTARQIAPMCHDERHGERPAAKIGHDLHKRAALQVWANPQERRLNQAKTGEGSGFVGLCTVDAERAWQLKRRMAVAIRIFPSMGPCAQNRRKMNCPVFLTLEIFYRSRDAMARQIGGTGGVDHAQQAQWVSNQRLVSYGPKPQYTVKPLLNQIDLAVSVLGYLQLQPGIARHEGRQGRHDRCARHLGRKIDPQTPAQCYAIARK